MTGNSRVNPFQLIRKMNDEGEGKVIYVPNRGNVGDAFIASATWQMFNKNGLKVYLYHEKMKINHNDILIYGGGGNLIPNYDDAKKFIIRYHEKVHALIVLPHTINGYADMLGKLGSNVYFFCREDVSYDYVCRNTVDAHVYRYDDLALQLDYKNLKVPLYDFCKVLKNDHSGFFHLYFDALRALKSSKNLYCFRKDSEATQINFKNVYDLDISSYFNIGHMTDKNVAHILSKYTLYIINKFEKVYTNRLHICIAGYLLNKEVFFYPNSYYKNKAVFDSCLKNLSDKITWINSDTVINVG